MVDITFRDLELRIARSRAEGAGSPPAGSTVGSTLSGLMHHGGVYSLADPGLMGGRLDALLAPSGAGTAQPFSATQPGQRLLDAATTIPKMFFYHLVENKPYDIHARLISYLTYPNVHLKSPLPTSAYRPAGKTFSQDNTPSPQIPAAMTFVGQFLDHDLTLNAVNLFDPQEGTVASEASPLIDLDSVYGPRIDDKDPDHGNREVPMEDGRFRLRAIPGGYDVCRRDKMAFGQGRAALIGDKRNDENQIILQIHLLLMRLHNTFRQDGLAFDQAKEQTILHWQSMVVHEYLRLVCDPAVVDEISHRLRTAPDALVHQPVQQTPAGPVYRMPHEFAIGFRFGHSQLRSRYRLNPQHEFRLFDSVSDGSDDLQGGKCLTPDRLIDWPYFLSMSSGRAGSPSNLIDTKVNQVVFDLPESTIPDDIVLVSNLPFRNLVRSRSVGLCSGEDLADRYGQAYGGVARLTPEQVEPEAGNRPVFEVGTGGAFRTPLWYYLLREAEVARGKPGADTPGHLGPLGSHLIAEVILSGIWHAAPSVLRDTGWTAKLPTGSGDPREVRLIDIARHVQDRGAPAPACAQPDPCGGA